MQLFIIQNDGEVHEVNTSGKTIGESLDSSESYILNDDDTKTIYLWKGNSCSVRSKFIGASKSQELRGQVGMHYKVQPVDEGSEPQELLDKFGEVPSSGFAREIREEKDLQFDVPGVNSPSTVSPKPKPKPKMEPVRQNGGVVGGGPADGARQVMEPKIGLDNSGPLYTGGSVEVQPTERYDFKKIMETLESLETPAGYERELIIIGNQAFSIIEKRVNFLGTTKIEKSMEKMGNLPEGVFLAKNYSPRVLCENQKVLAIELLRKIGSEDSFSSSAKTTQKLKPSSKDPRELAKSFGMKVE